MATDPHAQVPRRSDGTNLAVTNTRHVRQALRLRVIWSGRRPDSSVFQRKRRDDYEQARNTVRSRFPLRKSQQRHKTGTPQPLSSPLFVPFSLVFRHRHILRSCGHVSQNRRSMPGSFSCHTSGTPRSCKAARRCGATSRRNSGRRRIRPVRGRYRPFGQLHLPHCGFDRRHLPAVNPFQNHLASYFSLSVPCVSASRRSPACKIPASRLLRSERQRRAHRPGRSETRSPGHRRRPGCLPATPRSRRR